MYHVNSLKTIYIIHPGVAGRHAPYLPFRTFTCVPQWSPQVQEWTIPGTHLRYDIGWSLFNSRHAQCSSRHVLSGGQNVHAYHTRRAIKYQLATCYMAKEPWPLLVRKLTSNRHTSARPDSYANSWECSFGLSGDDHGEATGSSNDPRVAARIGSSPSSRPMLSSFLLMA